MRCMSYCCNEWLRLVRHSWTLQKKEEKKKNNGSNPLPPTKENYAQSPFSCCAASISLTRLPPLLHVSFTLYILPWSAGSNFCLGTFSGCGGFLAQNRRNPIIVFRNECYTQEEAIYVRNVFWIRGFLNQKSSESHSCFSQWMLYTGSNLCQKRFLDTGFLEQKIVGIPFLFLAILYTGGNLCQKRFLDTGFLEPKVVGIPFLFFAMNVIHRKQFMSETFSGYGVSRIKSCRNPILVSRNIIHRRQFMSETFSGYGVSRTKSRRNPIISSRNIIQREQSMSETFSGYRVC